jgi:putative FmdB family regulatory protein
MPTYEYKCDKCKKTFDAFQSMKDDAFASCPKELCRQKSWGKGKVRRLLGTGAGLIFKGSGFYITDYRSEGYKSAAKSESGAASSSGEGSSGAASTGGDAAKTAPKTESKPAPAEKKPKSGGKKD